MKESYWIPAMFSDRVFVIVLDLSAVYSDRLSFMGLVLD